MRRLFTFLSFVFFAFPALAHGGHLGELGGHSHILGWGLLIGAGLVAAAIGWLTDQQDEDAEEESSEEPDGEPEAT